MIIKLDCQEPVLHTCVQRDATDRYEQYIWGGVNIGEIRFGKAEPVPVKQIRIWEGSFH